MATKKAVLFNLWGVVVSPRPAEVFLKFEENLKLPSGFLKKVVTDKHSAMGRAERGKLTLSQMIPELCRVLSGSTDAEGPGRLAVLWGKTPVERTQNQPRNQTMLQTEGGTQSCVQPRVPRPTCQPALTTVGVPPKQALWLGDDEEGVGAAEAVGMTAVLVKDLPEALKQVEAFTGVQVVTGESYPASCNPEEVSHGYITIKPRVKLHYVEMGTGPPVMLCHGFPESWYSWRYQIPALADAGFRVLSLDMKGYGESTAPPDIEEYSQNRSCQDLVTFMDKMGIPQVTLVGHDWGGVVVWNMARCHPERVRAVASLNTPLFPVDPSKDPMNFLKTVPIFDYQLYFQDPGVAETEMEKDLARTFKIFFRGSGDKDNVPQINTAGVCARGGLFVGLPDEIPRSSILSETALQFYITQFKDKGFRGPLNWYRNVVSNWKWLCSRPRAKLLMPALMVTAGKDHVLLPVFSKGMETMIPNLTRGHIEECGHWTQMERPSELNTILISWLKDTHNNTGVAMTPKL
ncbi:bifunctional epoxide hydrolase 2 [Salvelinus sp. IW2-2015]|uniref:bifunctional epoxide hydrolase 2 n=1 Tax=Salvelinus sp. IW2-2015 TaxID=2691554 RepID=UPI0038D4656E